MDAKKIHNQNHFCGVSFIKKTMTAIANKMVDAKLKYNFVLILIITPSSITLLYRLTLHFLTLVCTSVKHILFRHAFHTNHIFFSHAPRRF